MPAQTGITTKTVKRIVLDAGAVYRNHGVAAPAMGLIGATRGGATFTVNRTDRMIEVDGTRGAVKGMKRTVEHTARLEFTLIEVSLDTLLEMTRGTATAKDVADVTGIVSAPAAGGTHQLIQPSNDIADADYLTNVALVGDVMGTGQACIVKLLNALAGGEWSVRTDDRNEGQLNVVYEAHYDPAAMNTPPYQILWPVAADA